MDLEIISADDIVRIFRIAQENSGTHLKYAILLKKTIEKENNEEFLAALNKCIRIAILSDYREKNIYVGRVINFIALLCTRFKTSGNDDTTDHPVLRYILRRLLEWSGSCNESCRYWSCKLLNLIFEDLEELSDDLYEEIKEAMLQRLKDPKSPIRFQAIISLHHLQDDTDKNDPIRTQFSYMMEHDYIAKIRHLCVDRIGVTKDVLPFVLGRIRDVDVNVRLASFKKVSNLAKYLTVTQKRLVLKCGFLDTSEQITRYVSTELSQIWLRSYDGDYLKLMKSLRLDACEDDIKETVVMAELILAALFEDVPVAQLINFVEINEQKLIEYHKLNWESVLYYKTVVRFFRQSELLEDALDKILPELTDFCNYIEGYCKFIAENRENVDVLEYHFTLQQLFLITQGYDVGDSASRRCLNSLVHKILQNVDLTADVAQVIVQNLEKTIPNVVSRSIFVCEIISNIVYGEDAIDYEELRRQETERNHTISQLKADICSLMEQEGQCGVDKKFQEAQRIKCDIDNKQSLLKSMLTEGPSTPENTDRKTDVPTTIKYLNVAEGLLRSPTVKELNPALATLSNEIIQKVLMHENDQVKAKAFKCYCLCCIVDTTSAIYGIHLFAVPIFANHWREDCDVQILIVCIKAVVDLLRIYGLTLVEKMEENGDNEESMREDVKKVFAGGTSLTDLIQGLADLLQHEDLQVQEAATKGVCILLLSRRTTSASLLSRIIIKWANPATDDADAGRIKQFIGLTLESLTSLSNCHTYFADAIITTIRTLLYAPRNSALADIDVEHTIKFMIALTQMSSQVFEIHADLAFKICSHMISKPRVKVNFIFSKVLLLLTIPAKHVLSDLLNMSDQLQDIIKDNKICKNITKFYEILSQKSTELDPIEE